MAQWLEQEVIEPSTSPWGSALVPVLKKDGSTRWALDYCHTTVFLVYWAVSYPLANIQENLEGLAGSKILTTWDTAQAYMTIRANGKSKPLLTFVTPLWDMQLQADTIWRLQFRKLIRGLLWTRFVVVEHRSINLEDRLLWAWSGEDLEDEDSSLSEYEDDSGGI